jgi:hypothetical protein
MRIAIALVLLALGCDEPKKQPAPAASATATASATASAAPSASASAPPGGSGGVLPSDAGIPFNPKYACPTGQSHFFFEGDYCRKKCITNADCPKGTRCSPMDVPVIVNGVMAGTAHHCEGI